MLAGRGDVPAVGEQEPVLRRPRTGGRSGRRVGGGRLADEQGEGDGGVHRTDSAGLRRLGRGAAGTCRRRGPTDSQSQGTTSPPTRVVIAAMIFVDIVSRTNRTEPSPNRW